MCALLQLPPVCIYSVPIPPPLVNTPSPADMLPCTPSVPLPFPLRPLVSGDRNVTCTVVGPSTPPRGVHTATIPNPIDLIISVMYLGFRSKHSECGQRAFLCAIHLGVAACPRFCVETSGPFITSILWPETTDLLICLERISNSYPPDESFKCKMLVVLMCRGSGHCH